LHDGSWEKTIGWIMFNVDLNVCYRNFGFVPSGGLLNDLKGKLFGHFNLLKRLQARDIMEALNIGDCDIMLDVGCGAGYFTIEMAKVGQKAYGIDVNPYVKKIRIPWELEGKLVYIQASGENLPFRDGYFDKVLASEVLPMVGDPHRFVSEIRRVLKPNGRLVISNGAGHPVIRDAFATRARLLRWLQKRYAERMPSSYAHYCTILQRSFSTRQKAFLEESDVLDLLRKNGFNVVSLDHTPGFLAGAYLSWSQFLLYLRTGTTLSQRNFVVKFWILRLLRVFEKRRHKGGLLCVAENP
jgi:ubiquinone/menaquinone biosynthesis C-methylase UbiE